MLDKSTNKVQFRQMEKSIQKISTICIGFGNRLIANFFCDQTIYIADCENLTIGHSLIYADAINSWHNYTIVAHK
jgi:hypothetical protein